MLQASLPCHSCLSRHRRAMPGPLQAACEGPACHSASASVAHAAQGQRRWGPHLSHPHAGGGHPSGAPFAPHAPARLPGLDPLDAFTLPMDVDAVFPDLPVASLPLPEALLSELEAYTSGALPDPSHLFQFQ